MVQEPLSHNSAAVVILTIQVKDKNADDIIQPTEEGEPPVNKQTDTAEATIYIGAFKADSPQFSPPWTPSDPTLVFQVKEQQAVGTVMFKLNAKDPVTGLQVRTNNTQSV